MSAKILTLATSKGGAGKSTLTRNLAAHWLNVGFKVAVIDADPQASVINRHNPDGLLKNLTVLSNPEESISYTVEEVKNDFDFILIDTGGFRNRTTVRALVSSRYALIPLKPSADDVAAAIETHALIQELNKTPEKLSSNIMYRMIITMSQQGTVISRHVRTELQKLGFLLMKSEMYHRVAYPESAINGLSPCITDPDGSASRDIANIVSELNELFA
ncbi:MAG: ParA family protein [Holosporales bacterium]|nr:ParA family protein [Holosporales bacterium]